MLLQQAAAPNTGADVCVPEGDSRYQAKTDGIRRRGDPALKVGLVARYQAATPRLGPTASAHPALHEARSVLPPEDRSSTQYSQPDPTCSTSAPLRRAVRTSPRTSSPPATRCLSPRWSHPRFVAELRAYQSTWAPLRTSSASSTVREGLHQVLPCPSLTGTTVARRTPLGEARARWRARSTARCHRHPPRRHRRKGVRGNPEPAHAYRQCGPALGDIAHSRRGGEPGGVRQALQESDRAGVLRPWHESFVEPRRGGGRQLWCRS